MTQIVVTLEDDSNMSIIRNTIKMIKGVKNAIITHIDTSHTDKIAAKKLQIFDQLAGSVSMNMIDIDDERTKYLLDK